MRELWVVQHAPTVSLSFAVEARQRDGRAATAAELCPLSTLHRAESLMCADDCVKF